MAIRPQRPDTVVVRVAALPGAALDDLRCRRTWQAVQEILKERDALAAEGRALALALEPVIADVPSGQARSRLVALRRALYNGRTPAMTPSSAEMPAELDRRVRRWSDRSHACEGLETALPLIMEKDRQDRHHSLRTWASTGVFTHGLVQASPSLAGALARWLDSPGAPPSRRLDLRLSRYLSRVVAKTSPHSTFTMMGLGHWGPGPEPVAVEGEWDWRTVAEPDLWLVRRLLGDLAAADDDLAARFLIRPNASLTEEDGRLWYLSRTEDAYRSVRASEPLRALLRALTGETTLDEARRLVAPDVLAGLVELEVLETLPPVADQSFSHLSDLAVRLAPHPATGALAAFGRALARHPHVRGPVEGLGLQQEVRTALRRLSPPGGRLPDKNLFHDNAVFASPGVRLGEPEWRAALDDLHLIRTMLGVFQRDNEIRLLAADLFVQAYGAGAQVPFARFHRTLAGQLATPAGDALHTLLYRGGAAEPTGPVSGEVAALRRYRDQTLTVLREEPEALARWLRGRPESARPVRSLACYVQVLPRPDDGEGPTRLVLNAVAAGHGTARSRVHRLLTLAGLAHQPVAAEPGPADGTPIEAEVTGLFGHNISLRSPTTTHEIAYPGAVSGRPPAARLALRDLDVRYDPVAGALELVRAADGRRVVMRHAGLLATPFLPRTVRLLLHLFGDQPGIGVPLWALFAEPPRQTPEEVVGRPRVSLGRVVVARATWYAATADVPRRRPGTSEAGHLLALARWFAAHGIPSRCFVFSLDPGSWGQDRMRTAQLAKPMFLDLADPSLVACFDRQLGAGGACTAFQEVLPELGGGHVMEYVVEVGDG
ncbi:lantibiotic dehydratase [Microbispora sp. RL4-1S]|uniref:Lantibiotic dehydratase n=1 Tax=Microbispora oryzae TaxID=2806554 RepID=A0A940WMG2_9ACTN|nr:lantibiotic dehydratase [Microbispora oryzae]MBP2708181.1 lantibiotic dehydratase [Microbispora oryzae]